MTKSIPEILLSLCELQWAWRFQTKGKNAPAMSIAMAKGAAYGFAQMRIAYNAYSESANRVWLFASSMHFLWFKKGIEVTSLTNQEIQFLLIRIFTAQILPQSLTKPT
jgi:hypothetical protein